MSIIQTVLKEELTQSIESQRQSLMLLDLLHLDREKGF